MRPYTRTIDLGVPDSVLDQIIKLIGKNIRKGKIIIYGSRANGRYNKTSDIDIAIDSPDYPGFVKPLLEEEIDTLLKFDVLDFRKAKPEIKREIAEEGIVLYEKN